MDQYSKLSSSKGKNPDALSIFLEAKFDLPRSDGCLMPVSDNCTPSKRKSEDHKIDRLTCLVAEKKDRIIVLEKTLSEVSIEKNKVDALLLDSEKENKKLRTEIFNLQQRCVKKVSNLNPFKKAVNKSGSISNSSLNRRNKEMEFKKCAEIKKLTFEVLKLKNKLVNVKKLKREAAAERDDMRNKLENHVCKCDCRMNEDESRKRGRDNVYNDNVRKAVIALHTDCGIAASKVSKAITIVSEHIFDVKIKDKLPCKQTVLNMCDEGYALSHMQIVENCLKSDHVTLHSDGTSRDQKKIVGHQFSTSEGDIFYLGYVPVATENASTLLDITVDVVTKLCETYAHLSDVDINCLIKDLLFKVTSVMTDRAAAMKCFDRMFLEFIKSKVGQDIHVNFLHCNAHYLLGLSGACEKGIAKVEAELVDATGKALGRDQDVRFSNFSAASENSVGRVIRTACDILGPRGDQKNGCRVEWTTFCNDSMIPSFKGNRFNCYFESAAAIIYHLPTLIQFFCSGVLHDNPNLKIESVRCDVQDPALMCLVCAVALFYLKVTSPYWKLVNSKVKYYEFHHYVKSIVLCFEKWADDPSELFDPNVTSIFNGDFAIDSQTCTAVHDFIVVNDKTIIANCLRAMCIEALNVTKRQLEDFLPGGSFESIDESTRLQLEHCPLTNLIGESAFGDFDFDISKRRNATLHNRSAVHCIQRNKTVRFLSSKSKSKVSEMFRVARKRGKVLRQENKELEEKVKNAVREKFAENQHKKIVKEINAMEKKSTISSKVKAHGGPCESVEDVDNLFCKLKSEKMSDAKMAEIFKNEIRYQKIVIGRPDLKQGSLKEMLTDLKRVLDVSITVPPAKRQRQV